MNDVQCPHCQNDDMRMIERIEKGKYVWYVCQVCSKSFVANQVK